MKIIGFSQLRNELSNGNLENWFRCMEFCDYIYIYDQASDDGSLEYYEKFPNVVTIKSPINNFENEISCKKMLLEKLLNDHPDVDWIFWIDGDTILDGRMLRDDFKEIKKTLKFGMEKNIECFILGHYNLWRSDTHYRVDSDYDWFHKNGRRVFWRNNGYLRFIDNGGLHQQQFPHGMRSEVRINRDLIHRGFATDEQILNRYNLYKGKGQSGNKLERLIDETTLCVEEIEKDILPDWYVVENKEQNPTKIKKLKEDD